MRPSSFAFASLITSTAAAPSEIWLALPAVTEPSFVNAGRSLARPSIELSARKPSSTSRPVFAMHCSGVRAIISALNQPFLVASAARRWLSTLKASCSARVTPQVLAVWSAALPMGQFSKAQVRPSNCMWSSILPSPYLMPPRTEARCGARSMFSMPPATTHCASPRRIMLAACITASRPEPQTLFTVTAFTVSAMPAFSAAWRAGFWPRPACRTFPMKQASTWPLAAGASSSSALMA